MYPEEQVIDGVLCWRGTPDGEFKPYTPIQLTERVLFLKEKQEKSIVNFLKLAKKRGLLGLTRT